MRALALVAFAVLLASCGGGGSSAGEPDGAPTPAAPASTTGATVSGTTLDGERISLADFRGRPVLVNVWSSW